MEDVVEASEIPVEHAISVGSGHPGKRGVGVNSRVADDAIEVSVRFKARLENLPVRAAIRYIDGEVCRLTPASAIDFCVASASSRRSR